MVKRYFGKNKKLFLLSLVLLVSAFLPTEVIESEPHADINSLVYIFLFSLFLAPVLLFFFNEKRVKAPFFSSYSDLTFFMGCFFISLYTIPTLSAFLRNKVFFLDGLLPISAGIGICLGTIMFDFFKK